MRSFPALVFGTPRALPRAESLAGRVVVLDIAFTADGLGTPFEEHTGPFIRTLGARLAAWVDHHDHERHADFAGDSRFFLATKAEHGACPEMITPELVERTGPIDTILAHLDFDGLYAAAKWIRGGTEPYKGADDDARAIDTRTGTPKALGDLIDRALRAQFRDDALKHTIVRFLVGDAKDRALRKTIDEAAQKFDDMAVRTRRLAGAFEMKGRVAYVDARASKRPFDKTELLLAGQRLAQVALVHDFGMITLAAGFESGVDFVKLLGLGGGMPTRVSIAESRLDEVLTKVNRSLE